MIQFNKIIHSGQAKDAGRHTDVFNSLPVAVEWTYNGVEYQLEHPNRMIVLPLREMDGLAVIDSPTMSEKNRAYIMGANGVVIWELSDLLGEKVNKGVFSDVYYIDDKLYFFMVYYPNTDFRFSFDPVSGTIGPLIESR